MITIKDHGTTRVHSGSPTGVTLPPTTTQVRSGGPGVTSGLTTPVAGPPGPPGPQGAPGSDGDLSYVHTQMVPSASWVVTHNLGKHPSVSVVDSAGTQVIGDVHYTSPNALTLTFSAAFGGTAYLN